MRNSHNTDVDLNFYNDRVKEVMDAATMAEPFTYVPIKAGHMELVTGNALVFGKITEGYDIINPVVNADVSFEDVSAEGIRIDLAVIYHQVGPDEIEYDATFWDSFMVYNYNDQVRIGSIFWRCVVSFSQGEEPSTNPTSWQLLAPSQIISRRRIHGVVIISIPEYIYVGSTYYISITNANEHLGPLTASYLAQPGDTTEEVKDGLRLSLIANGVDPTDIQWPSPNGLLYLFPDRNEAFQNTPTYQAGTVEDVYSEFTTLSAFIFIDNTAKFPILKCGAMHGFGIVYKYRSGRQCSVMKTDDMSVYIPFYTESDENDLGYVPRVVFSVYHKPPERAETYEIVYFGNLTMDYFVQIRASDINQIVADRFSLNVADTFERTTLANARWRVAPYEWHTGDRIRLIGTINVGTGVVTKYAELYDYEIEGTGNEVGDTPLGDWLWFQAVNRPVAFDAETNILVEIYRPKKGLVQTEPTVAYGAGMVFEIGVDANGFRYHKGNVDQVFNELNVCTTAAEINNTANDSWKFVRLNYEETVAPAPYVNILPFWAESIFPSDWWEGQTLSGKLTSNGFPFLDDKSLRQTYLPERFRWGGFLITGTRTNNISHFVYDDFRDLPKKNGEITGMREVGYTLKFLQRYKETSVYINRIQTFSADGGESDFSVISDLIGTIRPLDDDYGCQHPNSVMVNGRNLYYWDNNEGAFIRSSPNGHHVLSGPEYKVQRWFKDLLEWIMASGGAQLLDVNIGANNDHEEIWATWRIGTTINGIIFSEKKGRFTSRLNQITEAYLHLGNFFAHLYHQRLWIMNIDEGQNWLYWSGNPVFAEVEVVSNAEVGKNKVFNAIAQFADHLLQSLARYIRIPAEASGAYELMETNAPVFELKEGVYFGEIMKDVNSKGNFVDDYDKKLNGREMRGRYCYVRLRTEEHDEKVRIDSIAIMSTLSERNV